MLIKQVTIEQIKLLTNEALEYGGTRITTDDDC